MTEDYLHYIYKYKLFDSQNCSTIEGESIEFVDFGIHNMDSGPDFSQAKVKIGDTLWAGNVEIHINSSDWKKHNHQKDKAYDTVILHVVYNHDEEVKTTEGAIIPTLEIKNLFDYEGFANYQRFVFNPVPCIQNLKDVPEIIKNSMLDQMLVERIISKTEIIKHELEVVSQDWEQVFFQAIAKSMGLKVNAFPMEQMAKSIPFKVLKKLGDNQLAIEAILFGQAGFLDESKPENFYYCSLQKEYQFHKSKHNLVSIKKESWKFSKMRPSNFPTLRIAQLAQLILHNHQLFSSFINKEIQVEQIHKLLNISIENGFWYSHYTFKTESKPAKKSMGKTLINSIVINTISPFIYLYGNYKADEVFKEKAIQLLENLPSEDNKITRVFEEKINIENAAQSQGLIHCHNEFCVPKKCLDCSVGVYLLKGM